VIADQSKTDREAEDTAPLLGALLRMPYQAMMTDTVEPRLAAAGYGDVRSAHFPVLQALTWSPLGLRATDLASHARITKQSMGYLVEYLEEHGYIERVPDPTDGRAKVVRLTPLGWQAIRTVRDTVREVESDWAARIGRERIEQLRETLRDLVKALGQLPENQR
jgi:DNA-binding MarR family transcriptional regulator